MLEGHKPYLDKPLYSLPEAGNARVVAIVESIENSTLCLKACSHHDTIQKNRSILYITSVIQ